MKFEKPVGFAPVFLIPLAWMVTLFQNKGVLGVTSVKVMHVVMLVFLPVFLYVGWNRLNQGVLKVWRNVIFAGLLFTITGSAGLFLDLGASLTFFPELIYWAIIPGIATVYTSREAEWDKILLVAGTLAALGGFLFATYIYTGLVSVQVGLSMLAVGQGVSIFQAVKMDKAAD